jgi:hypothetical protein
LGEVAASVEQSIFDTKKRISDLNAQIGQPFEYQEKLATLLQRQQEITDALDLTKNQASAQLAAETAKEPTSTEPDSDALHECYDGEWY